MPDPTPPPIAEPSEHEKNAAVNAMLDEFPAWPTLQLRVHALARAALTAAYAIRLPPLLAEGDEQMTPEEVEWVRAQRITEEPEPEECRALPEGSGRCAYAGPDGSDACGTRCIYQGQALPEQ